MPRNDAFDRASERTLMNGSVVDSAAGLGAIVLTILGLLGVIPSIMAALAILALGVGFLSQGVSAQARYGTITGATSDTHMGPGGFGSGLAAETVGGLATLALGVLTLIGLSPFVLIPVAVIALGATMILGSTMLYRLNEYLLSHEGKSDEERAASDQAARGTSSIHLFVGIGAVVLGILTLVGGPTSYTYSLVALIGVGAANLISGAELVNRSTVALSHA